MGKLAKKSSLKECVFINSALTPPNVKINY